LVKSGEETSTSENVTNFARSVEIVGIQGEWKEINDERCEKPANSHGQRHGIRTQTIGGNFGRGISEAHAHDQGPMKMTYALD
jgi:hypothetical protein